jgi:thiamine biosynthesis lipoprotein
MLSCESSADVAPVEFKGHTMGTTYSIKTIGPEVLKSEIEESLLEINQSLSTYIDTSLISSFNQSDSTLRLEKGGLSEMLLENYNISKEIFLLSGGAFDPTVMPLVNLWGFGYADKHQDQLPDTSLVDSVKRLVGFDKIKLTQDNGNLVINKPNPGIQLDFSAVAKGYGVDRLAEQIEAKGCTDYMVEIGGEVRCKGQPSQGRGWKIGINKPIENAGGREIQSIVELKDQSMATSGNYRNFYEVDGVKVSHSINPVSGFPERSSLLSATIVHKECAYADAMATACMILGLEKAKALIIDNEEYEAYFIFGLEDGSLGEWHSTGFPNIQSLE